MQWNQNQKVKDFILTIIYLAETSKKNERNSNTEMATAVTHINKHIAI